MFYNANFYCTFLQKNYLMLKIKEIRNKKGLKQDEICELTGIKKRSYVAYEQGKTDIPFKKLQKIANSLGVRISDFIEEKDDNVSISATNNGIIVQKSSNISQKNYNINNLKELVEYNDELLEQYAQLQRDFKTLWNRHESLRDRHEKVLTDNLKLKGEIIDMLKSRA